MSHGMAWLANAIAHVEGAALILKNLSEKYQTNLGLLALPVSLPCSCVALFPLTVFSDTSQPYDGNIQPVGEDKRMFLVPRDDVSMW